MFEVNVKPIKNQVIQLLTELLAKKKLGNKHILVVGTSTSEVLGEKIGTAGSEQVAKAIFEGIQQVRDQHGFHVAFQGCEHINRVLVVEEETADQFHLDEVTVVPVPKAGGAMAAYAFRYMNHPVVVEHIRADAGIDIGDTLIGMHLKPVVVPFRSQIRSIGHAHVTAAFTRPKLVGGERAIYSRD
ncbi:TIGR01440 family protein [Microaerobacter geothermalis]|uniref:TIGR01440 family protein n=1 Tax=Microaerobacter geothermalis TaxID=674972 RepID=UPI001F364B1B|nr:TIGR01440 family protein [Microaerobacter geothermalis]MCF6093207.1 TIGR01440 family protein [Microaerobacter geothermalis]